MGSSWARRLGPAAAFQFSFVAAAALLKPAANALVLARYDAHALPWLYMAAAGLAGAFAVWAARRKSRARGPKWLALSGGLFALTLAAVAQVEGRWLPLVAYLFAEAFTTQVSLSFWGAMGDAFDAREARRAFTWINGIGMSGAICGGLAAQLLAHTQGASALLIGGGLFLLAGATAYGFHRSALEAAPLSARGPGAGRWLSGMPYARLLAVVVVGFALASVFTDWVFRERAAAHLNEAQMAGLFGSNQLWTGVFCVLFQLSVAELLLRKVGILKYVALIPLSLFGLTGLLWVWPTVWTAWLLKVVESAASWSLLPVAFQLLYAPLPDESRNAVRQTIDGFLRKASTGLAGLALLLLAGLAGFRGVLLALFALSVGIALALWRLKPRYVEAVHARVAGVQASAISEADEGLLLEMLKAPSPDRVLRGVDLLEHAGLLQEHHARLLLAHPHERAQERGVLLAERHGFTALAEPLEQLVLAGERRPRDAAVWALARLAPARAAEVLPGLLNSQDAGLLCAAVGGALSLPGLKDARAGAALDALLNRGASAPTSERREVARLFGRVGDPALAQPLARYLEDGDATVRRIAITSVGEGAYSSLAPKLVRALSWRDDRRWARDALARLGDQVVPLVAATMDDRHRALALRVQLPRVLRQVGTQAAFDALLFSNSADDPSLHYRVGVAMARLHEDVPALKVDRAQVMAALSRRRDARAALLGTFGDLRAGLGDQSLLSRVVGDRLDQALQLSFWLLGLLHEDRSMRRAHAHVVGLDPRRRAFAREHLDNTLSQQERTLIDHALDVHHRAQGPGRGALAHGHVERLCHSDDYVLRACARQVGRTLKLWQHPLKEDDMSDVTLRRLFALEGVEVFAQSDVDDLAAVAAVAREASFRQGERIYSEGDPGDALYVVVEGRVEARRDGELVLSMKEKESFGETSLFDGAPRVNEVIATVPTRCLVIDRRDFLDLIGDRPELLTGMFRVLSRQLKSVVVDMSKRLHTTGENPMGND